MKTFAIWLCAILAGESPRLIALIALLYTRLGDVERRFSLLLAATFVPRGTMGIGILTLGPREMAVFGQRKCKSLHSDKMQNFVARKKAMGFYDLCIFINC